MKQLPHLPLRSFTIGDTIKIKYNLTCIIISVCDFNRIHLAAPLKVNCPPGISNFICMCARECFSVRRVTVSIHCPAGVAPVQCVDLISGLAQSNVLCKSKCQKATQLS